MAEVLLTDENESTYGHSFYKIIQTQDNNLNKHEGKNALMLFCFFSGTGTVLI